MKEKIDLTKLLKDCPSGMELDCTIWNSEAKVFLKGILNDDFTYPIEVTVKYNNAEYSKSFTKYGSFNNLPYCKCVIFPKGTTSWEGFHRPFVDGDIVYYDKFVSIFKKWGDSTLFYSHISIEVGSGEIKDRCFGKFIRKESRFATEEEKQKLFDTLKAKGYKWNDETKTLEKLIVPKFKVGDKIRHRRDLSKQKIIITEIRDIDYVLDNEMSLPFTCQESYELFPKFDPRTLRSFDKVLVADSLSKAWYAVFLSHIDEESKTYPFAAGIVHYRYCIPYNDDTKHLAGKPGEPPEFYKYWEE